MKKLKQILLEAGGPVTTPATDADEILQDALEGFSPRSMEASIFLYYVARFAVQGMLDMGKQADVTKAVKSARSQARNHQQISQHVDDLEKKHGKA